ncbi:hypothetical protein GQX73_g7317 [Xylaria multiplex]|uniref:Mak10 subunit, NatC N(Alpha)-terminal acetyltransferase n=1 Tax=Xylaria multiplex TaxID=323545 RepID=A0A7C8IL69_9PEZI|nr:hypothetical protein GQX73_g7317 [Xylaria multiplex]
MPPPPNISHPGIMAIDITDQFTSAVGALSAGELVKDEHFTLFESVSGLEIMDRKMDSGALDEGESLDEEYDVTRSLLPEEIIGILDQLLCLEMAWHLGYPLSQTLLTSVYIDALMKPGFLDADDFTSIPSDLSMEALLPLVLRAYCYGLIKSCFIVNECMKEELYYEEEDFVTNTYERNFLGDTPVLAVKGLLQTALTELRAPREDFSQEIRAALESRIELRIAFLDAIDLSTIRNDTSELPKLPWKRMRHLIDAIEKQHALGKPVPEAFSTKLQRRLASTMPPRPMVSLSFDECITHFKRFFQNGNEVLDVLQYTGPHSLLNFVLMFQAQKPQPLVFIRTVLQNLLFKDMVVLGRFSVRQLLDHDVSLNVLPCGPHFDRSFDDVEVMTDPRHKLASGMEVFRHRVADQYFDLLRILCQNRCRVRRTLCHHIREWDALEADVGEIEGHLQAPLHEMEWIVQLGFELRVYQPDEFAGMYHYLKRLAALRARQIEQVKQTTTRREERARRHLNVQKDDSLPLDIAHEFSQSKQCQRMTMIDAACTWEFSDGLSLLYMALLRLGLVKPPPRPYGTGALRYELRMRPFARVPDPPLPTYEEFRQEVELSDVPVVDVLHIAEGAVGAARKGLEACVRLDQDQSFAINATAHSRWVSNAKDCLRATIATSVAISTLKHAYDRMIERFRDEGKEGEVDKCGKPEYADLLNLKIEIPEPGDGYHDWWIVPKLTRLK